MAHIKLAEGAAALLVLVVGTAALEVEASLTMVIILAVGAFFLLFFIWKIELP